MNLINNIYFIFPHLRRNANLINQTANNGRQFADGAGAGARDLIAGKIVRGEYVLVLLDLQKILDRPELVVDQKERSEGGR